jgi:hypothetical protein
MENGLGRTNKLKNKMKKLLIALLMLPSLALAQKTPKGVVYDAQIFK